MLPESTNLPAIVAAVTAAVAAGAGISYKLTTWRNGRRNNIENHRLTGERRPSDCKPGLGKVCLEHGRKIVDFSESLGRLASYQENFQEKQAVIDKRLEVIQGGMATLLERQDMPHTKA